jgi:proteasome lid subunit RPN8/RPN11
VISALLLPSRLKAQIDNEAREAFPGECCGLIEAVHEGEAVRVLALHPTRNLATAYDRFEIDPAEQFRLMHALRGTGREIAGCYHSHPNGRAEPSAHDLEHAGEDGFVWLIAAVRAASEEARISAFVYEKGAFKPMPLSVA